MKTAVLAVLAAMAISVAAEEIPLPAPVSANINMTGFDVERSEYVPDNGNWIITASCIFSVPVITLTDEQIAEGEAVITKVIRILTIVVTPAELAATLGVEVDQLDNITNAQLKAGVRGSALAQAAAILGL